MTDGVENFCMVHVPTRAERFWRMLGFRYHLSELPDGVETEHPGWMMTVNRLDFSLADRFRLLLTGRLTVHLRQAPNVPVDSCVNALSWKIHPPGDQLR